MSGQANQHAFPTRAAAALINLDGYKPGPVELTSTSRRTPPRDIITHHLPAMSPYDATKLGPLTTSTPARILLDLGSVSPLESVEYALEDALRRRLTTLKALKWELRTQGGRGVRGTAILKRLLKARPDGYVPTDSWLEVDIDKVLRTMTLPRYVHQFVVHTRLGTRRPDFAFPEYTFAIEGESYVEHSQRSAWDYDKQRDAALRAEGWDVLYATWEDVHGRTDQFKADVYERLNRRGWPGPLIPQRFFS